MNTPEPYGAAHVSTEAFAPGGANHPGALDAGLAGAPDAADIARLANLMFAAPPAGNLPSSGVAPPSVPGGALAPSGTFPPSLAPSPPQPGALAATTIGAPYAAPPTHAGALSLVPPHHIAVPLPAAGVPDDGHGNAYFRDGLSHAGPHTPFAAPPALFDGPMSLPISALLSIAPSKTVVALPASVNDGAFYFMDEARAAAAPAATATPWSLPTELRPEVSALPFAAARPFDPRALRQDFPILHETVHGRPLIWFDNAATTQKPQAVIDRLAYFYAHENSNIHRGAHALAARATDAYEAAREKVRRFLGAGSPDDIVFVRGATEGINFVAQSWGRQNIAEGDEIVVTWLEHHANIVPWQQLASEKGAVLRVVPVDDTGQVRLDAYEKLLGPRTRLVALPQVSNALGTIVPVRDMVAMAHRHGACVLVDGAQSVSHMPVNVQELDCDFFVFSGHKVFGPTGIGAVHGKPAVLAAMPPWQGGGNMIADVTFERTIYQTPPNRFEAGTGNIADAVGLGAAIDYVDSVGMHNIAAYEHGLLHYATERLLAVPGLRLIGTAPEKAGVLSFVLHGLRSEDVGKALDREGIAVRSGHHCAQPILRRFGLESTVRASFAFYNLCEEVDALAGALMRLAAGAG